MYSIALFQRGKWEYFIKILFKISKVTFEASDWMLYYKPILNSYYFYNIFCFKVIFEIKHFKGWTFLQN